MKHLMTLQKEYFKMIKSGKKTIELRLFDEKRKMIKKSDTICFSFDNQSIEVTVIKIIIAKNFQALAGKINLFSTGFKSFEDLIKVLNQFYPEKKQDEYGVIAIQIKV